MLVFPTYLEARRTFKSKRMLNQVFYFKSAVRNSVINYSVCFWFDESKQTNSPQLLFWLLQLQNTFVHQPISHHFPLKFFRTHDCPEKRQHVKIANFRCFNEVIVSIVRINLELDWQCLRQGDKQQNQNQRGFHALSLEKGLVMAFRFGETTQGRSKVKNDADLQIYVH